MIFLYPKKSNVIIKFPLMRVLAVCLLTAIMNGSSITTSNCPLDYDPTLYLATSVKEVSATSQLVYGSVYSREDSSTLQASFSSGDTGKVADYIKEMSIVGPFLAIGLAFSIVFLISVCCCIF